MNLLITSAGGISGTFLIRHLLDHPIDNCHYNIVAVDSDEHSLARYMSPTFYHVPKCNDPRYEKVIYDIIIKENIHMIFPVTSYDTPFYAKHKNKLSSMGVKLLVCDSTTHELLHNKKKMYALMSSIGVPTPLVYENQGNIHYPAMIKACESSGSVGVHKLESSVDRQYWTSKLKEYVITDYVHGKEFTVDCLFDQNGKLIIYSTRERKKVHGGGVVISKKVETAEAVKEILKTLESHLSLIGPVNFQYILDENNHIFLTDFNTRFASGGLPLTIAAGNDIPNVMVQLMLGLPTNAAANKKEIFGLMMYRYYHEFFVEEE
ncbi:carbamoyl-phosphate synthase large subunit [Paenibacillus baekrokdamisoli]|nr:carbamoyl-phosphate synthase large subunit [Paenibacillus baekrokdamisoli]